MRAALCRSFLHMLLAGGMHMKHWKSAVLALAVLLAGALWMGRAVPANGWGLSFQTPGGAPAGPVSPEQLRELGGPTWTRTGGRCCI